MATLRLPRALRLAACSRPSSTAHHRPVRHSLVSPPSSPALLQPSPCLARYRCLANRARGLPTLPVCLCCRSTRDHGARPPTSASTCSRSDQSKIGAPADCLYPARFALLCIRVALERSVPLSMVNSYHARRALRPLPSHLRVDACLCDVQPHAPIVLLGLDAQDRPSTSCCIALPPLPSTSTHSGARHTLSCSKHGRAMPSHMMHGRSTHSTRSSSTATGVLVLAPSRAAYGRARGAAAAACGKLVARRWVTLCPHVALPSPLSRRTLVALLYICVCLIHVNRLHSCEQYAIITSITISRAISNSAIFTCP